ncbi:hypothetical protein GGE07_004709 [Sinorhizobium terangae]|nr:hypothetical protein [Sinorhizobium terangae]
MVPVPRARMVEWVVVIAACALVAAFMVATLIP